MGTAEDGTRESQKEKAIEETTQFHTPAISSPLVYAPTIAQQRLGHLVTPKQRDQNGCGRHHR